MLLLTAHDATRMAVFSTLTDILKVGQTYLCRDGVSRLLLGLREPDGRRDAAAVVLDVSSMSEGIGGDLEALQVPASEFLCWTGIDLADVVTEIGAPAAPAAPEAADLANAAEAASFWIQEPAGLVAVA